MRLMRRVATILVAGAVAGSWITAPAVAQGAQAPAPSAQAADARGFLDFCVSSATLQAQASQIALRREPRPEVAAFARAMAAFRQEQMPRLQGLARDRGWPTPTVKEFEHQVVLENLEPLDFLALSRRYTELQIQALEQEVRAYQAAERLQDEGIKRFVQETLPALNQHLSGARELQRVVGP